MNRREREAVADKVAEDVTNLLVCSIQDFVVQYPASARTMDRFMAFFIEYVDRETNQRLAMKERKT